MIEFHHVTKRYGKHTALSDCTLRVPPGSLYALLGPNGSGKTTLLKILLGIVYPEIGSDVRVQGRSILGQTDYKSKLGYMPQYLQCPAHLKVCEIVSLLERLRGAPTPHRDRLLDELQMKPFWKRAFGNLSGGMKQKVNILQCFMFDPEVAVIDEPTMGLDPSSAYYLKSYLKRRKEAGKTTLFTSHVMSEVEEMADTMVLLVDGKLHTVISPAEMKRACQAESLEVALFEFWKTI